MLYEDINDEYWALLAKMGAGYKNYYNTLYDPYGHSSSTHNAKQKLHTERRPPKKEGSSKEQGSALAPATLSCARAGR